MSKITYIPNLIANLLQYSKYSNILKLVGLVNCKSLLVGLVNCKSLRPRS